MSFLAIVLAIKIVVIGFAIAIPFLTFSSSWLAGLTGVEGGGEIIFRLYGVAILALLIGYASAFPMLARGAFPWFVVVMGIVSNGGATAVLVLIGAWRRLLLLTSFLGAITAALVSTALDPSFAVKALW